MFSAMKHPPTLLALCLACVMLGSCAKSPTAPKPSTSEVNPDKPNGNGRIQAQSVLGDPTKGSTIVRMTAVDGSSYYFYGQRDNVGGVGRISSSGALQWFTAQPYTRRGVLALSPSVSAPDLSGLVVSGKHDNDNDGQSDVGYVWLYTASGSLVSSLLFSSDSSNVWVNDIAAISDTVFVLVGGESTPARTNPFVAIVTLTAAGQLARGPQVVLTSQANTIFDRVAVSPTGPSGGEVRVYATAGVGAAVHVVGLTAPYPAMTSWNVDWSREIAGTAPTLNDLRVYEDRIYVAGFVDDPTKQPPPGDGGYWNSGLAARLTLAGGLEWTSTVRLTAHSESFSAVVPTANGIFFLGVAGRYFQSGNAFEYGWIARILPATGAAAAHLTFGQDTYASAFNTAAYNGSTMYCGGFTNYEVSGGPYQAWFSSIDVANATPSSTPARAQTAAIPGRIENRPGPRDEGR
jgi:hypothetical protein